MSKAECPVCGCSKCYGASYTNVICAECGSLLNRTPFGIDLEAKFMYKEKVKEWRTQEEVDKLKIGVNIE